MPKLSISDIRLDGGTQPRAKIDPFKIDEYSEDMERGDSFPAVTVFHDGSAYWLADGFHRIRAAQKLGRTDIECDVKQGTRRDAVLHSVGANAKHGLRRTNEDKRRAAMTLLEDDEWAQWSNSEIARRCAVSHTFINSLRSSLEAVSSEPRTYTTKHGTVATMNTANIGKVPESIKAPEQVVYDEAPEQIKQAVANEELTIKQAFDIHAYLKDAPQRFKDFVLRMRFKDTWRIEVTRSWFDSNNGDYSKFECVEKSGVLDWGDDDDGIDIRTCTLSELRIGEAEWKAAKRTINIQAAQKEREDRAQTLPESTYNVIYADPPWQYNNTGVHGAADNHYPTMPLEDICSFLDDIKLKVDDNAVLFMWVTNPFLEDAFKVVNAWGFSYKTHMVWVKTDLQKPGSGFYVRGRHELLFICTKGAFTPLNKNVSPPIGSVLEAPVQEHSRKPDNFYDIVETLYPQCNYIELFARRSRDGWHSYGNEVDAHAA